MKLLLICLLLNSNIQIKQVNTNKTLNVPYYKTITNEDIIKSLNITKTYKNYEFNIQPTFSTIGVKNYILYAIDELGNQDIYDFKINVYDDVSPLIYGPDEIHISLNQQLNIEELLNHYYIFDEMDKEIKPFIEETNYSNENIKSEYYLRIYVSDKSNNFANKKIKIIRDLDDFSFFYKDNLELTIYKNEIYTSIEILDMLITSSQIEKISYKNVYFSNSNNKYIKYTKTGKQKISLLISQSSLNKELIITLNIIDKEIKKNSVIENLFIHLIEIIKEVFSL